MSASPAGQSGPLAAAAPPTPPSVWARLLAPILRRFMKTRLRRIAARGNVDAAQVHRSRSRLERLARLGGSRTRGVSIVQETLGGVAAEIITPPDIVIEQGTLLDYRLRLRGIPLRWQSEISVWEPPLRFVDRQTKGPYSLWVHEHTFAEHDRGTIVGDRVEYAVPGGRLVQIVDRGGVRQTLSYFVAGANAGMLAEVADHFGRTLRFAYNPRNFLVLITDPDGNAVRYEYDASVRLKTVTYPGPGVPGPTRGYFYEDPDFPTALTGIQDEAFDKIFANNVKSVLWLAGMTLPGMAGGGSFIVVGSIGGLLANTVIGAYGISKAADHHLVRNLAAEWGPKNVRVNAIAPGLVKTEFARALWEDEKRAAERIQATPLRRLGEPRDIGGIAVFLASDAAAFITGQCIVADGGVTIL